MSEEEVGREGSQGKNQSRRRGMSQAPLSSPEIGAQSSQAAKVVKSKKTGGSSRSFILLLLLLVVAVAGFYFYGMDLLRPADTPVKISSSRQTTKIKVPLRTRPQSVVEEVEEVVVPQEKVAVVERKRQPATTPKPAPAKPAPRAVAVKPAFTLVSGSYLYQGSLKKAVQTIESAGFEVSRSEQPELHEVTRLLVGRYDKPLAQKRLNEVKKLADGVFLVAEEGRYAVYAGSYLSLDKARRAADLLYQQGVRVEEKQVRVDLPKTTLRFGRFVSHKDAENAAKKLGNRWVLKPRVISLKSE